MSRAVIVAVLALCGWGLLSDFASAQTFNPGLRTQNNLFRRPTVSPYLNLLLPQGGGLPNYQTIVRPQIEQQRRNQETQRQISALQSSVALSAARDSRGETQFRPTGHTTGSFYYSHFYPLLSQRRR